MGTTVIEDKKADLICLSKMCVNVEGGVALSQTCPPPPKGIPSSIMADQRDREEVLPQSIEHLLRSTGSQLLWTQA